MRRTCTGLVIVGVGAGLLLALAYRNSRDTGTGLLQSLKEMPANIRQRVEDLQGRVQQAVDSGRQAAVEKESEIETVLTGDLHAPAEDGAHSET